MRLTHGKYRRDWLWSRKWLVLSLSLLICLLARLSPGLCEPIKIGVLACLTTECAEWGANSRMGAELAVSEINSRGGLRGNHLQLIVEDTAESSGGGRAVSAFQKLSADKDIHFFLGPTWSEAGMNLVPLIGKRGDILVISPSLGISGFNEAAENIFNLWPHDSSATRTLAQYAWSKGWRRVGILSSQKVWDGQQADSFTKAFGELGGSVVAREDPEPSSKDLRSSVLRILKARPVAVFFATFHMAGLGAKALREFKYVGGKIAVLVDDQRIKESQGGLEGAFFARYQDATDVFAQAFKTFHGVPSGISADTAYDAIYALVHAVDSASSLEPSAVARALLKQRFSGASGEIRFDEKGGVVKLPRLFQVTPGGSILVQ